MMLFNNQVIMDGPQQAQQDQETVIKSRLSKLKSYLNEISQLGKQSKFSYKLKTLSSKKHLSKKANQITKHEILRNQYLKNQIAKLKNDIETKSKNFYKAKQSNFQKNSRISQQSQKVHSPIVFVYHSRIPMKQPLTKLIQLLKGYEWDESQIFINKQSLILLSYDHLNRKIIKFSEVINNSLSKHKNFVKFTQNSNSQRNYILSFVNDEQAQNWFKFLKIVSDKELNFPTEKWNLTSVNCLQSQTNRLNTNIESKKSIIPAINIIQRNIVKQNSFLNKNRQNVDKKLAPPPFLNSSFKSSAKNSIAKKISIQNSIFNLSNSSENLQGSKIKYRQQQLVQSIRFEIIPEENSRRQSIKIETEWMGNLQYSHTMQIQREQDNKQYMLTTVKLQKKMEQKRKLLSESSYTNLGIYWHEDQDQKSNVNHPQFDTQSISVNQVYSPQQMRPYKNQSISLKKNQLKRESSLSSPYKIKRVQSVTRDKSNSRESSQIQFQNKNRKKTDFSLQLQEVKINSKKKISKNQIRDHYLNRLIQKQSIKQIGKNSSKQIQAKQQLGILIPIPEKNRRPSQFTISNHSSKQQMKFQEHEMSIDQFSESEAQRQSTELQIQIQQLKNGITLQKCSKNSWGIKQKRLYISNAMTELCYCDSHDASNEKRIYIKDITSIQFGRVSKGILKHKKSYQKDRCLLIRINKQGKQKLLQFYLQQSQPCQNLKNFVTKLQKFTQMQNQQEISYQN